MAEEKKNEVNPNEFVSRTADNGTMFLQNILNVICGSYHYYAGLYDGAGKENKANAIRTFVEKVADANWQLLDALRKSAQDDASASIQRLAEELKQRPTGKKD